MAWNRPLIIGLLVVLLALSWWRLQPDDENIHRSQLLMGTVVEIMAAGMPAGKLEAAVDAAFDEIARLDKLLSRYHQDSEVSRLSQSDHSSQVTAETAEVLALGLDVALRSGGAFDLTLGRLKTLWAIDGEAPSIPHHDAIAAALIGTGPTALTLDGQQVTKRTQQLQIDLGGIAKGYAVDRAIAVLKQHGITSAAINAGGDMYLLGQRPQRPWRIGIQHPRHKEAVLETVQVSDQAVVTSGDYERFFEQDGIRYHHIFDPQSGQPARVCQSVTIIADSVALGDALATAVFVLGPEAGLLLLSQYPRAEGLIVAANGTLHSSAGWGRYRTAP
ncbi:MAG: FAD:protein FMN transferase [Desulfuromonadales bacterium]|nr:FAD:protein FMN transferase [Desulfuromonadales bacterium]